MVDFLVDGRDDDPEERNRENTWFDEAFGSEYVCSFTSFIFHAVF